jgi:1,2-diacylglycerol 3-alpha-glucosyltransferase
MKVVMLCDYYDEKCHYQENLFAKYYAKYGHDVTVIASTFDDAFAYVHQRYDKKARGRVYCDGRVKVIKLPYSLNLFNRLRKFDGVEAILEHEEPDVIFSHDIHLNLAEATRYKRLHPACRIIMDYHADYSNSAKNWLSLTVLHKGIRRLFLRRHRKYVDKIYPVVPASADFLNEVYGIPYDQMELLPLAADTDLSRRTIEEGAGTKIRQQLGISADAKVVFTGGKLSAVKRTHLLAETFALLDDCDVHLIVVGDASDDAYRKFLAAAFARNRRIHPVGWVSGDDVYKYMDACDIAVFPASQSVLWQQALSMGLPIVVGRVGVQDASYMNLYGNVISLDEPSIRPEKIAGIIRDLLSDSANLRRLQEAARLVAEEILNYHRQVPKTLGIEDVDRALIGV